ncbi:MAG TPA: hypothetical protein VMW19_16820 [Myxococcota bacterium]|nr:hypothetical protein [Myxococcota bacterium]
MAESLFEFVAARLEEATSLDKLEARGTVRIALKEAGLDPRSVTVEQMAVLLVRAMPKELGSRGIERADEVCRGLVTAVKGFSEVATTRAETPEDIFRRLGTR